MKDLTEKCDEKFDEKFDQNSSKYFPTATFELFHTTTAVHVVSILQIFLILLFVAIYWGMESHGFFIQKNYFRLVVASVATLYFAGITAAIFGVYLERRPLLNIQIIVLRSLMIFADMIALSIILIMAIGNRQKWIESIPSHFVNQKRFYNLLGPFWMYLGAISLHITVAGNMIFLKIVNCCMHNAYCSVVVSLRLFTIPTPPFVFFVHKATLLSMNPRKGPSKEIAMRYGLPDRWLYCPKMGNLVTNRFFPFKTPLCSLYDDQIPDPALRFHPSDVFSAIKKQNRKIGLWIDLTKTDRYYGKNEVEENDCKYRKLPLAGHGATPTKDEAERFIRIANGYLGDEPDGVIGIHCTHGFNRTGFLICAYLWNVDSLAMDGAVTLFAQCRPCGIYKQDYINDLFERYEKDGDMLEAPERPSWDRNEANSLVNAPAGQDDGASTSNENVTAGGKQFMEGEVPGVTLVNDPMKKQMLRSKIREQCGYGRDGFPGSQPVSLESSPTNNNLRFIAERPYMVSWKADGMRYLVYIQDEDEIFAFDRDNEVFQIPTLKFVQRRREKREPFKHLTDVLVDCEVVIDKVEINGKTTQVPRLFIFDIIHFGKFSLKKENYELRRQCINKEIIGPRADAIASGFIRREQEVMSVRIKEFWDICAVPKLFDEKFVKNVGHEIDGLIFQPCDEPYIAGRQDSVLKWKPPSHNSVDFLLQIRRIARVNELPFYQGCLYVQHYDQAFANIKATKALQPYDGKIIECTRNERKEWVFMRERTDKSLPNSYKTAMAVLQNPLSCREVQHQKYDNDGRCSAAKGNNIFKKTTGRKSDYWMFVNREGRGIFQNTHRRRFNCKDKGDSQLMGRIWHELSAEKRAMYRQEAQQQNAPDMVKQRRNEEALRCRASHQNAGLTGYEMRMKIRQEKHEEIVHRLAANAATESDLSSFTDNPLFFYGESMHLFALKELEFAKSQLVINYVEKKGEVLKGTLQNQNYAVIKVNIYDSIFVSASFKARAHPSELSLVIFNQAQGILKTKSWIFTFNSQLLYGSPDGVPENSHDNVQAQENKTNIFVDHKKKDRKNEVLVYQGFNLLQEVINEYNVQRVLVSKRDWNHSMSALFFLAHAAQCEKQFKDLRPKISLLEETLVARDFYWKKREPKATFHPFNQEKLEEFVSRPMMIDDAHNRILVCAHHAGMATLFQINCSLARAAVIVHNIFAMWMETKFADWDESPQNSRFSFAQPMTESFPLVDPEASIEPVLTKLAEMNVQDLVNEQRDNDAGSNPEEQIFHNTDRDDAFDNIRYRNRGQPSSYASLQNDGRYSASLLSEKRDPSPEEYRSRQQSAQQYRYSSPQQAQYDQYGRPRQDVQNSRYSPPFQVFQERQSRYQQEDQRRYSSPQRQQEPRYSQDDRYIQGRDENRYPPGRAENRYPQGYSSSQNGQQQRYYQEEPRHRQRQPEPRYPDRMGSNIPPPPSYDEAIGDSISRVACEPSGRASQNSYGDSSYSTRMGSTNGRRDESRTQANQGRNDGYDRPARQKFNQQSRPAPRMGGARATPQFEEMTTSIASSSSSLSTSKEQNHPKLTFKTLSKREFYDFESEKQRILGLRTRTTKPNQFSEFLIGRPTSPRN
ncbi:unnamed protein product, partial [Mesorhabditis belari]|uniref:mRNA guanylyltransferase n=1 Tax=Mesorhabditis belari TaxID=2138241 RepID=A0AAF3J5V4_9BILA